MIGSAQFRKLTRPVGWLVAVCLLVSQVLALPALFDASASFAGHDEICSVQPSGPDGTDGAAHDPRTCCVLCYFAPLLGLAPPAQIPAPSAAARRTRGGPRRENPIDRRRGPGHRQPRAPPR